MRIADLFGLSERSRSDSQQKVGRFTIHRVMTAIVGLTREPDSVVEGTAPDPSFDASAPTPQVGRGHVNWRGVA